MEPGKQLAHYTLVEKIGEGGMGQVWRAKDDRLDRDIAIKVLNTEFSSDARRLQRFQREAKLLASINHPNIATIYELEMEEGEHFIAMELIPGEDLATKLDRGLPTFAEALRISRQIAAALEATHERGVIHRDLKPANVHVTPAGDVKVLDFGIARDASYGENEDEGPEPTRPGSILGTVSYMSPEQARGKPVDAGTDLWAFGCVLYRLLAGKNAFPGDTRWDRLAAVLREEPDWKALPESTPPSLVALIRRCLAKDRDKRLDNAGEARRVVDALLGVSTISAEGSAVADLIAEDRSTGSAMRWLVFVVLAVVAVWLGARAVSEFGGDGAPAGRSTQADRSVAVLPFENNGGPENAAFTAGIHDDILNRVALIGDLRVISRRSVMEYLSTDKTVREIGNELRVATLLEGGVQRSGDQVRINLRLVDVKTDALLWSDTFDRELSAEEIFSIQSDVAGEVATALQATLSADEQRRIDTLPTTNLEAYDAYLKGLQYFYMPGQLAENLVPSRTMFERATQLDPNFALAYAGLSRAARDHFWLGGGTLEAQEAARIAAERALEIDPDLSAAHLALGTYLYTALDYDAALEELSIAEQGMPGDAEILRWKAYILRRRGQWEEALRALERASSINPRDAEAAAEVGFTLLNLRRYEEADAYYCDAIELAPGYPAAQIYGAMIPLLRDGTVESAQSAADGIERVGEVPWKYAHGWQAMLAVGDFERAEQLAGSTDRVTGQWHDYPSALLIGWTHLIAGRTEDAVPRFEEAARILEADVAERPDDAKLYTSLGIAYAGLGRSEEAIRAGEHAVALMPIEKDTFVGSWLLHDLGWIYVMTGRHDQAVEAFDRILEIPSVWSIELLLSDPRTDPLRDHAGFRETVARHASDGRV